MAVITDFNPKTGIPGTLVTIQGSGFLTTSSVNFGTIFNGTYWELQTPNSEWYVGDIISVTDTEIQVRVPQSTTLRNGNILIGGAFQSIATSTPFNLLKPTITDFNPKSGPSGTIVTILGTNFTYSSGVLSGSNFPVSSVEVKIGGMVATINSITSNQIIAVAPTKTETLKTASPKKVELFNGIFNVLSSSDYTFPIPSVSYFSPSSASIGQQVTIYGSNLQYNPTVVISYWDKNQNHISDYTMTSQSGSLVFDSNGNWCSFLMPLPPSNTNGIVDYMTLRISTDYNLMGYYGPLSSILIPGNLNFPNPTITQISPLTGFNDGSVNLIIYGSNLQTIKDVKIGNTVNQYNNFPPITRSVTSYSQYGDYITVNNFSGWYTDGTIKCYDNRDVLRVTSSQVFDWTVPTITSLSPSSGAAGTVVTIYGKNFRSNGTTSISFNGVPATNWSYGYPVANPTPDILPDRIIVTAPISTSGPIQISNDYGSTTTSYTYPPIPITVNYSLNTTGGGTITSVQYSKNGGAWTTFPRSLSITNMDDMQYRATFTKASGCANMDVQITTPSPGNSMNDSTTSSSVTRTTWGTFRRSSSYTLYFTVNSYNGPIH